LGFVAYGLNLRVENAGNRRVRNIAAAAQRRFARFMPPPSFRAKPD
jgi:hypothetical protein